MSCCLLPVFQMEKLTDVPCAGQIFCRRTFFSAINLAAGAVSAFVHGDQGSKSLPLPDSVICFRNVAAAVVSAAVLFAFFHILFGSRADCRYRFCKSFKEPGFCGCILQVVQRILQQVIVAHVCVIDDVKVCAEPV